MWARGATRRGVTALCGTATRQSFVALAAQAAFPVEDLRHGEPRSPAPGPVPPFQKAWQDLGDVRTKPLPPWKGPEKASAASAAPTAPAWAGQLPIGGAFQGDGQTKAEYYAGSSTYAITAADDDDDSRGGEGAEGEGDSDDTFKECNADYEGDDYFEASEWPLDHGQRRPHIAWEDLPYRAQIAFRGHYYPVLRAVVDILPHRALERSSVAYLPRRVKRFTVLKSPLGHSKARAQYEVRTHKMVLTVGSRSEWKMFRFLQVVRKNLGPIETKIVFLPGMRPRQCFEAEASDGDGSSGGGSGGSSGGATSMAGGRNFAV